MFFFATIASPLRAQFRVLLYHAHSNFGFSDYLFTQHMDFLKNNDYHTITLDWFYEWRQNDKPLPIRPIVITFDDDYIPVYTTAYPILKDRGFSAVNFAHTQYVGVVTGSGDHCDWTEIQEMENAGVFYTESHTATHSNLTTLSENSIKNEVENSKASIESNMSGKTCRFIAYPYGAYNGTVITLCQNAGYSAGFAVGGGLNYRTTSLFEFQRIGADGASLATYRELIGYNALPPPPPGPGWTIDNKEVNFSLLSSDWVTSTTPSGFYGSNYLYHAKGDGAHPVRWAAYLPHGGSYNIHACWISGPDRSSQAQYEIHHKNGMSTVQADQKQKGGQWNLLGRFDFTTEDPAMVFLKDSEDGSVTADGIWFEPLSNGLSGWVNY
jgi:peptidoglycan/xylan/chitin deacetylase (PgdA/CDA1 family)